MHISHTHTDVRRVSSLQASHSTSAAASPVLASLGPCTRCRRCASVQVKRESSSSSWWISTYGKHLAVKHQDPLKILFLAPKWAMASISFTLVVTRCTIQQRSRPNFNIGFLSNVRQSSMISDWWKEVDGGFKTEGWNDRATDWWMMGGLKWEEADWCYLLALLHKVLDQHPAQCFHPFLFSLFPSLNSPLSLLPHSL